MTIQSQFSLVSNSFTLKSYTSVGAQSGGARAAQDPAQALSSLQDKALNAIAREIPGMDAAGLKQLDPAEYTPEKVAGRISQFVAMGLESARARGKSEDELQALYESAVKGVEQGFKEAKDILSNLKVLDGAVAEQVGKTEQLTFEALGKLAPQRSGTETEAAGAAASASLAVAQRYQQAEDFSLTLKTRDGDEVRVSFSRALDTQGRLGLSRDGEGNSAAVLDVSRTERTGYEFSVAGDLSAEELDAIQNLVRDVGNLAKDFFNGDVQKAFEQAPDIAFDSSQLASMNLTMSRSESYSAARIYEGTQRLEQPAQTQGGLRLGHMLRELRESVERPALDFLDQPDQSASQILRGLVEQDNRFQSADPEQQSHYQQQLQRLLSAFESPQ